MPIRRVCEIRPDVVVAVGERRADVEVGGLGHVAIAAQPPDPAHVAALVRLEHADVALIDLARRFEEQPAD